MDFMHQTVYELLFSFKFQMPIFQAFENGKNGKSS